MSGGADAQMMEFVIGTHSVLMWVRIDSSWQVVDRVMLKTGFHYGIALLDPPNADAQRILCKHNEDRLQLYRRSESFELVHEIPLMGDHEHIHQIAYANGGIYLSNTKRNSIVFQALDDDLRHEYFIDKVNYDQNHVNSVFPCGEQILVLLNNRGRTESQIVVFNHNRERGWIPLRTLSLWHRGCHNVFADGRYLVYNASSQGRFAVIDLQRQKLILDRHFDGAHREELSVTDYRGLRAAPSFRPTARAHTKGLSVTGHHYIIGVSDHTERENRYSSGGRLVVMDRQRHDIVAVIRLDLPEMGDRVGNINEIRCVSERDYAHSAQSLTLTDLDRLRLAWGDPIFRVKERVRRRVRGLARALRPAS